MVESDAVVSPAEDIAESGKLAAVVDFLAHKQRREDGALDRYYLTGLDGIDRVELTEELFDVLKRAAEGLRQGQSASLLRRDQEITTQQAAIGRSRCSAYRRPDRVAEDVVRAATRVRSNPTFHPHTPRVSWSISCVSRVRLRRLSSVWPTSNRTNQHRAETAGSEGRTGLTEHAVNELKQSARPSSSF
ncbi:hypothetical protein [Brevibacterium limosum]|uniref:hypothetical protein n=1 Tax=Brevibacterium limosum TaxID=2697565 RepID=UPI0014221FA4|nr:hypothetical protein [Brevibacterium limosum]